ncbi:prenyltransferase/squalene oxidase repeat-containing protein [Chondromyces crocatus]|nr:prenyltransferase/squalene oxidase repeat-containing protein [Chondromyces crocatus]
MDLKPPVGDAPHDSPPTPPPVPKEETLPDDAAPPSSEQNGWWYAGPDSIRGPVSNSAQELDEDLVQALERCITRAIEHTLEAQTPEGSWFVLPDARMFDTGLVAYVLSRTPGPAAAAAVERAKTWLATATPQTQTRFSQMLDETPWSLLSGTSVVVDLREPELYSNVFRRKTLFLYALTLHARKEVLSPFSQERVRAQIRSIYDRAERLRMKQWSRVDLMAVYLLLEALQPGVCPSESARLYLESMQATDGSFCHNPVSSALALLALLETAPESTAYNRCLQHLLDAQQPDGTWRFCISNVWDTSLLVRAYEGQSRFEALARPKAIQFLMQAQNRDGGWGFRTSVESDTDTTSCVLLSLAGVPDVDAGCIARGIAYLAARQRKDGLWNTWQSQDDQPVEDCVAHALSALTAYPDIHRVPLESPYRWLVQQYEIKGRWRAGWYRSFPYAVLEIGRAVGAYHPVSRAARKSLLVVQNEDGGWGEEPGEESYPSPTGLSLAMLLDIHQPGEAFIRSALRYLVDTQRDDGTWPGRPEVYGPRPLLYHLATNTHAFVIHGLLTAWSRLGRTLPA